MSSGSSTVRKVRRIGSCQQTSGLRVCGSTPVRTACWCSAHPAPAGKPGRLRKMQAPSTTLVLRAPSSFSVQSSLLAGGAADRVVLPLVLAELLDGLRDALPVVLLGEVGAEGAAAVVGPAGVDALAAAAEDARPAARQPRQVAAVALVRVGGVGELDPDAGEVQRCFSHRLTLCRRRFHRADDAHPVDGASRAGLRAYAVCFPGCGRRRTLTVASRSPPVRGKGLSLPGARQQCGPTSFRPDERTRARREEAVMALSLPANPDLEHLRRDARGCSAPSGPPQPGRAGASWPDYHPEGLPAEPASFALADAQLVVARGYGFASWPRLRAYLARPRTLSRDPAALDPAPAPTPRATTVESASARSGARVPDVHRPRRAGAVGAGRCGCSRHDPDLVGRDVFVAAVAGDAEALRPHVAADPRRGDPGGRPVPVAAAALPRLLPGAAASTPSASARLLLDAGADPDSGYLWQGLPTAVHRADRRLRRGRAGPGRQPRHPQWRAAGRAAPRARRRPERPAGALQPDVQPRRQPPRAAPRARARPARRPRSGRRRTGEPAETIDEMLARQVDWARAHGFVDRLAAPRRPRPRDTGSSAWPPATSWATASRHRPWPGDPRVPDIHRAATPEAVRAAVAAGARVDSLRDGRTALHQAAFMDDVELVTRAARRRRRPDRRRRDARHDALPTGRCGPAAERAAGRAARRQPRRHTPEARGRGLA